MVTKYIIGAEYTREEVYSKGKKTADFMVIAAGKELVEKKEGEKDEGKEEKEEEKKEKKKEERRRRWRRRRKKEGEEEMMMSQYPLQGIYSMP